MRNEPSRNMKLLVFLSKILQKNDFIVLSTVSKKMQNNNRNKRPYFLCAQKKPEKIFYNIADCFVKLDCASMFMH